MKSHIAKSTDEKKKKINIPNKDKFESKKVRCSSLTRKRITDSDAKILDKIEYRHKPADPDDVFSRLNFSLLPVENIEKERWPNPQPIMMFSNDFNIMSFYKQYSDNLLKEYIGKLIEKGDMQPISALRKQNIIDIHRVFSPTKNKSKSELSQTPKVCFDEDDYIKLYSMDWKIFIPFFKQQFIHANKYCYVYIDTKDVDYDNRSIRMCIDEYSGENNMWIVTSKYEIRLTFGEMSSTGLPCHIDVIDVLPYEKILTQYIDEMPWDNKSKNLWCDIFDIPRNWKDASFMIMIDTKLEDEDLQWQSTLLYNKTEENVTRKLYGQAARIETSEDGIKDGLKDHFKLAILSSYIQLMSIIAIYMYDRKDDEKVIKKLDNEMFQQTIERMTITSFVPYEQGGVHKK